VALYILNQKRAHLRDLEERFGVAVLIEADDSLTGATTHAIERGEPANPAREAARAAPQAFSPEALADEESEAPGEVEEIEAEGAEAEGEAAAAAPNGEGAAADATRRRRRRRRRRGGEWDGAEREPRPRESAARPEGDAPEAEEGEAAEPGEGEPALEGETQGGEREGRTDGRRGRRRRSRRPRFGGRELPQGAPAAPAEEGELMSEGEMALVDDGNEPGAPAAERNGQADDEPREIAPKAPAETAREPAPVATAEPAPAPKPEPAPAPKLLYSGEPSAPAADETPRPRRSGWWQKAKLTLIGD